MTLRTAATALAASALLLPSAALAGNGHGKSGEKHVKKTHVKQEKSPKTVKFVFKGTFTAPGTVTVTSGNAHVRKGGFVGQAVTFDLASAKLVVADVNGDGVQDLADVADGDAVKVQARAAKGTKAAEGEPAAFVARKLIDRAAGDDDAADSETGDDGESESGDDAVVAPPAP